MNEFRQESVQAPPATLLNLSVAFIDALQVEFSIVEDPEVFSKVKTTFGGRSDDGQGQQHPGDCLVFTKPDAELLVVRPQNSHPMRAETPRNFVETVIAAWHENGYPIPMSQDGLFHAF